MNLLAACVRLAPFVFVACATQPALYRTTVPIEVEAVDSRLCQSDGTIIGTSSTSLAEAKRNALEKAGRRLVTHVVWRNTEGGGAITVEGDAYRCRADSQPAPQTQVQPQPPPPAVDSRDISLGIEPLAVNNNSASPKERGRCSTVMILEPEGAVADGASWQTNLLERELLRLDINVVSSAITARVFVDGADGEKRQEGVRPGTALSHLERALLLAKRSEADCVFQCITFKTDDDKRFFTWDGVSPAFIEGSKAAYEASPHDRRWYLQGSLLRIEGKVIDVKSGKVFAAVSLSQSSVNLDAQSSTLKATNGSIAPGPNGQGWVVPPEVGLPRVREAVMKVLAREIAGPSAKTGVDPQKKRL